jgi:hypothetical protein
MILVNAKIFFGEILFCTLIHIISCVFLDLYLRELFCITVYKIFCPYSSHQVEQKYVRYQGLDMAEVEQLFLCKLIACNQNQSQTYLLVF